MILVCIALMWAAGFGVVRWCFPRPLGWSFENILLYSLAAGVGIGITSSLYFAVLALAGPNRIALAAVEGAAVIAALALGLRAKPRDTMPPSPPDSPTPWYLNGAFVLGLAIAAMIFVLYSLAKPHGEWDAWSIWNMRARFLARAGAFWTDAFSSRIAWSHPDYPLLLPGAVALCWTLARAESTLAPAAIGFLFTFAAAGVLIATLAMLRGKTQAFLAGMVLLGSVTFVEMGATQYADVPMSFYIVATLALLFLQDREPREPRFSLLAGLMAGFAAWTKNEGLLFVAAIILARTIALARFGNRSELLRPALLLAGGALPPLLLAGFFKWRYAPPNDLMSRKSSEILGRLADPARLITNVEGFVRAAFGLGSFLVPILLLLALYWYLVRFQVQEPFRAGLATAAIALSIVLAGDFGVYLLLSGDLAWQLGTSIDRVLLQLWPAGLLMFFLAANPVQLAAKTPVADKHKTAKRALRPRHRAAETR